MSNPFTPDFGASPSILVGRRALLESWASSLLSPRDRGRTTMLLSPRGTGKTVMLNEMEDVAGNAGIPAISVDTSTHGLPERIAEQIEMARDRGVDAMTSDITPHSGSAKSVRAKLGLISAAWAKPVSVNPNWSLRRTLTSLATTAAENGRSLLLSVDELHAADVDEARRLASDLQHLVKRERLPLCFVGASLPFFRGVMRSDRKLSFFNRCAKPSMPLIEINEAADFYRRTISDAGGFAFDDAVDVMASACDGNAYKMQLIGHRAWVFSGAPDVGIDADAAHAAVESANRAMYEDVFRPLWDDLSSDERRYLERLATSTDPLHVADLPHTGSDEDGVSQTVANLLDSGCINYDHKTGVVSLGLIGDRESIIEAASVNIHLQAASTARRLHEENAAGAVCGKPMKRVPGNCVLPRKHSGRCRSKY